MSENSEKKSTPARKKTGKHRRWRWLFFILLLLSLAVGVAQGPLLRRVIEKAIGSQLVKAQLHGSFTVEGSLFSGIELHAVELNGEGYIRSLKANSIRIDYRILELIDGEIRALYGDGIQLQVDIANNKPSDENPEPAEPPQQSDTTAETDTPAAESAISLEKIRNIILPIKLIIHQSSVSIRRGERTLWQADNIHLTHQPNKETFHLAIGEFTDMDAITIEPKETLLTWSHNFTSIENFPLRADARLTRLACHWDQLHPKQLEGQFDWENSQFTLYLEQLTSVRIELNKGEILLNKLAPWLGVDHRLDGRISSLRVTVDDLHAAPNKLKAELHLQGRQLHWDDRHIKHAKISASTEEGKWQAASSIQLDQESPTTLTLTADLADHSSNDWLECWHNAVAHVNLQVENPDQIATWTGYPAPTGNWPKGKINIQSQLTLDDRGLNNAQLNLLWNQPSWVQLQPANISLDARWHHPSQNATVQLDIQDLAGGNIRASGQYSVNSDQYHGELSAESLDLSKLLPTLQFFEQDIPRAGRVNLHWKGEGAVKDVESYRGNITADISGLEIEAEAEPALDLQLTGHYTPNLNIGIDALQVTRGKLRVNAAGHWKNETLELPTLELHDEDALLARGSARLPLSRTLSDFESFLRQPGDLELTLKVDQMPLAEIYEQLPASDEPPVKGQLTIDFNLGGTLLEPTIHLSSQVQRIQLTNRERVPVSDIELLIATQEKSIRLNGTATPDGHQPLILSGSMPFRSKQWIDKPDSIQSEPIDLLLDTKSIDLSAFTHLFPHISKIDGSFQSIVKMSGTVAKPQLQGDARLKISELTSISESIPNLRDIDIQLNYKENKLTLAPSTCLISGGKYSLQGAVDFQETNNPVFDISLVADKALLWRDDAVIARSDASLRLSGPFKKANISGDIGIVQSLFYKDVYIIPLGSGGNRAGSQRAKAELPAFTRRKTKKGDKLNIPEPFNAWTLDLTARTKDDFLIRGNIAKGRVRGEVKVGGTLANPQPQGELVIKEGQASLPFSRLQIKEGKVFFTPKHGFDPQLSIKASSRIGSYDVDITLYGLASAPKTLMTSRPPLPENEIIFLLATGSTSEQLSDGASATGKAYQLLVDSVIRSSPGRFRTIMNTLAELNEKVDINIGASDPFTGRKYNSARVDISNRWHVVASIDLDNHTRGLVVYAIQFK